MGDYKTLADNIISNSNGSINWVGSRTISSSADLTNNMLFVNGNLTINGNIDSENTTYSKLSDVRTNLIVVMGNIYIKSNVANLDESTLQGWGYAARFIDTEVDTIAKSIAKMTKGLDTNEATFQSLGVTLKNTNGTYRTQQEIFLDTIDALLS